MAVERRIASTAPTQKRLIMSSPKENPHQSSLTVSLGENASSKHPQIERDCSAPETRENSIDKSNEIRQESRANATDSGSTTGTSSPPVSSSTASSSSAASPVSLSPLASEIDKECDSNGDQPKDATADESLVSEELVDGHESKDDTVADLKEIVIVTNSDEQVVQCEIAFNSQDEQLALISPNQQLDEPSVLLIDANSEADGQPAAKLANVSGDLYSSSPSALRSKLLSKSDQVKNALSYIITTTIKSANETASSHALHNESDSKSNLNSNKSNSEPLKSADCRSAGELSAPVRSPRGQPCATFDPQTVSSESSESKSLSELRSELRSEDYLLNSSANNATTIAQTVASQPTANSSPIPATSSIVHQTSPSTSANKRKHSIEQLQIVACRKSARLHESQAYHSDNSIYLFEPLQRKRSPPISTSTHANLPR